MANNDKYHHCTNEELLSLENNVNRLLNMSQDYDKSYLDEEIKAIQSARKVSIQQRMENRKEKDK